MIKSLIPAVAGAAAIALSGAAWAQHGAPAAPSSSSSSSSSGNLQGDQSAWINDPHWHAYYDLTVQAFAKGPDKVDEAAYQKASFALFADFATSHHMKPEMMIDHLKLIPGQVVKIVREDPAVLKTYDNFVAATFGPQ